MEERKEERWRKNSENYKKLRGEIKGLLDWKMGNNLFED